MNSNSTNSIFPTICAVLTIIFYNSLIVPSIFNNHQSGELNIPRIIGAGIAGALGIGIGHGIAFLFKKLK